MSAPAPPTSYRGMMQREEGDRRTHLADPLITINPKDIDAQTRIPSISAMATLATTSKWASATSTTSYPERGKSQFDTSTLAGVMDTWEYEYEKKAISLDGKGREEYSRVASFVAVGQGDSEVLTSSLLNEGSKNLGGKSSKTSK